MEMRADKNILEIQKDLLNNKFTVKELVQFYIKRIKELSFNGPQTKCCYNYQS